jgi:hypothetical protein
MCVERDSCVDNRVRGTIHRLSKIRTHWNVDSVLTWRPGKPAAG